MHVYGYSIFLCVITIPALHFSRLDTCKSEQSPYSYLVCIKMIARSSQSHLLELELIVKKQLSAYPAPSSLNLQQFRTNRSGRRVLDLGTGLGISGIVAAGLGADVLLQDRPALREVGPSRLKWWEYCISLYIYITNCFFWKLFYIFLAFFGKFHVGYRSPPEFIVNLFWIFWWCARRTHCNNVGCLWHSNICIN